MIENILNFMSRGGFVMYPLVLIAVAGFTLIFERFFYIKKNFKERILIDKIRNLINADKWEEAQHIIYSNEGSIPYLFQAGLHYIDHDLVILEDRLKQVIYEETARLEKNLPLINIIAVILPMLGLLGTVIGMISVFSGIATLGSGGAAGLSKGVSEALVTTEFGLAAAIPTLFFYHILSTIVDRTIIELKRATMIILNMARLKRTGEPLA